MNHSRRDFLRRAGIAAGTAAMASTLESLALTSALAGGTGAYKALVCIFLGGGNDSNNMIIPYDDSVGYPQYLAARQPAGLALLRGTAAGQLDPTIIRPANPVFGNARFALHPNMATGYLEGGGTVRKPALLQLWNQGKVAVVCNVGPLAEPLTSPTPRQAAQSASTRKPYQLYSHSDQQQIWMTSQAERHTPAGWGGRIADREPVHALGFPVITTVAGVSHFTIGTTTRPLAVPASGNLNNVLALSGYNPQFPTAQPELARRTAFDLLRGTNPSNVLVRSAGGVMDQAVSVARELSVNPTIATAFPGGLGAQLLQVAKVIKANLTQPRLGLNRQILFTSVGGFDTHNNQLNGQGNLMTQLSQAIGSFYTAMQELNIVNQVTMFTLSDFNRTLDPASSGGTVGSDHAWGSHQLVVGGAVNGGRFYGNNGHNGTPFPTLLMGRNVGNSAVQDAGSRGQWVPSTAVDQYAATLASWFGVSTTDLNDIVFPYLRRFTPANLGFMT